ncbi:MAG: hypothetical protein A3H96_00125 [Acidobacteria bacterium RIFCSPLOWO2_02_FULL_67_36]|nr:MAG: hypothetical protein A3H96_00125 [Acidobacteria bacterium RIFCSPLOWO2_02_FULL_67_36]OFW19596.1 MAG: hypothetical protein A3G21_21565 [Acidobacteria bacterium RIFCSPLOWO2_12_FULL_66_21]
MGLDSKQEHTQQTRLDAPSISLPAGGGAIRGIGEKFAANPVTGTGAMSVPITTSPGRSGFGPQLALSYDSGAGNGPFGFGWMLSVPAITRKTDKGLPLYDDAAESDVYVFSGADDLVPVLNPDHSRFVDTVSAPGTTIHRYRPRIEGSFSRIERWTANDTGEIRWRSITRENVTTIYGRDNNARVFDPEDPNPAHPTRVFSWLACETYDDKGNAVLYEYAEENDRQVDTSQAHERNRMRTANRYPKRIRYGNRVSRLVQQDLKGTPFLFEVVFDYGEGHCEDVPLNGAVPEAEQHRFVRAAEGAKGDWPVRPDPFSSHRGGFEQRTYRRCQRVLMFHRFDELGDQPCLVRATEFDYADFDYALPSTVDAELAHQGSTRYASFIRSITQAGFVRDEAQAPVVRNGVTYLTYLKAALPPLEFEYSKPRIQDAVQELDPESLEHLPAGLDGSAYRWLDLDGEGLSGILTEQADAWFYSPNLGGARFGAPQPMAARPSLAALRGGRQQLLDLAGDGQLDLAQFGGPMPGFYERTLDENWDPFTPFVTLPDIDWDEPNLRFVDLDGDGHPDVLITEDHVFTWHPSRAEEGFGPALRVAQALDEEEGPRLVFADGEQAVYLADMCGDGLTDLVRIRNGEICYWANIGYGRFSRKVAMDNAPWFDRPDQFDQRRVRLADVDGSGTNDVIYLAAGGPRIYFNQSGNRFSDARPLSAFPRLDNVSSIVPVDLFGNGTACLVWSSPLASDARRQMRYVDLMGGQKPHLLVNARNNLGAETRLHYVSSTFFYLQDKHDGRPWITRLPFPVHVVDRVETIDWVSRNRFASRHAYHHGYFDGEEREFRGFAFVEQWDTEQFETVGPAGDWLGTNIDPVSHVPPVYTKTWFHTGAYVGRDHVSDVFAGLADEGGGRKFDEYYREPAWNNAAAVRANLLPDTVLPVDLTADEEREACRALKGSMLRQEVYALDGAQANEHPYTVMEHNFTIERVQRRGANRHAVFFVHAREAIDYNYERNPADPRVHHALTLQVDDFGNVLRSAAVAYPRRNVPGSEPEQRQTHIILALTRVANRDDQAGWRRVGLPVESRSYEVVKPPTPATRFEWSGLRDLVNALVPPGQDAPPAANCVPYGQWDWRTAWNPQAAPGGLVNGALPNTRLRLIEHARTLYRRNDLTALYPLGTIDALGLAGEQFQLAFPAELARHLFVDSGKLTQAQLDGILAQEGKYVHSDGDADWWMPSGRAYFAPNVDRANPANTAVQELAEARAHFFLPRLFVNPFGQSVTVDYVHDLLTATTTDAVGNTVSALHDYRALQSRLVTDPNGNRKEIAFDALGMPVGTADKGKIDAVGDTLAAFARHLTPASIDAFLDAADPHVPAINLLAGATSRFICDTHRFWRTRLAHPNDPAAWLPVYAATLARETHVSDPVPPQGLRIHVNFSYSDGFGREIQKKLQAEPGPLVDGGPIVSPRWVGSGWTIFNNKGKPVRQYLPFFSQLPAKRHQFERGVQVGVSPILFYDPVGRAVATLHPNQTFEKVVFNPWGKTTYDVNDTVAPRGLQTGDPRTDPDISGFVAEYFKTQPNAWQTWHQQRIVGGLGQHEQIAAQKAEAHADTPATTLFDALGQAFVTLAHNGFKADGTPILFRSRMVLDIEGNQREVRDAVEQNGDARGRIVEQYEYDMAGRRVRQASMEAGERWILNDVRGTFTRAWNSRGHAFRSEYDRLRRPLRSFVTGANPAAPNQEMLTERVVYGEQHPQDAVLNLRGSAYLRLDQSGAVAVEEHDFKGNPLRSVRRIARDYTNAVDWAGVDAVLPADPAAKFNVGALEAALGPILELDGYTSRTTYDALNRLVTATTPATPAMPFTVLRPGYNESNLLANVDVNLRGAAANGQPVWTAFIADIRYDAKGQRTGIDYGNGVVTEYRYDPLTFRLATLLTSRNAAAFPNDCPQAAPAGWPGCQVQNLRYTYDPIGNITDIRDAAQQAVYFRNKRVEPSAEYIYDPMYRLIEATGREHLGQIGGAPIPHSPDDAPRVGIDWAANDGNALGRYVERYRYDAVGNFLEMQHLGSDPVHPGWTRTYAYLDASLIENGAGGLPLKTSNRLSSTTIGNANPDRYVYDAEGNTERMPHLGGAFPARNMEWDYRGQLRRADTGGSGTAYYVCDAGGQRVRKVWERPGNLVEERLYLGGFEIFRRRQGAARLERETLHVMDGRQRVAIVETRTLDTAGNDPAPTQMTRYQLGNHLGSATLELDDHADISAYEEYTPYGCTSYQAVRSQTETPRRHRYGGKERDEETGFYYHGARYYAPWVGRWTSCDPKGIAGGINVYGFTLGNPIILTDPTGQQGENTIDDLLTFLHAQAGFETGAVRPPTFNWRSASPFGTAAHARAPEVLKEMKALKIPGAERIYSEVRVIAGQIDQIGGTPGGPKGSHNIDIMVAKEGQTLSKGQSVAGGVAERVGDLKYGGGTINPKYGVHGSPLQTITGRTQAGATIVNDASTAAKVEQGAAGATQLAKIEQTAGVAAQAAKVEQAGNAVAQATKVEQALTVVADAAKTEQMVNTVAKGAEATSFIAKAAPVLSAIAKPLAVVGKVAGPLGLVAAGAQLATAKTTDQKVDAGITAVSSALMMSKHPVAIAAGGGLMAGQIIDKTLNVSDYSSAAGVAVYEKLKDAGMNDTASFVIGGVASVVAIPSAIGYGAAAKVASWFN